MAAAQTLEIQEMGARGDGVAHGDSGPIYVPCTLPGETVRAEVDGKRAQLVGIVDPSPERVAPPCPYFGACGGCQLQHWQAGSYRAFKRNLVVTALSRAGVEADVNEVIDATGTGRRRATLHGKKGRAGFNALRAHTVHDLDTCPILVPQLGDAAAITRAAHRAVGDCDVALTATDTGLDVAVRARSSRMADKLTGIAGAFPLARLSLNGETLLMANPPQVRMGPAAVRLPVGGFLQATEAAETVLAGRVAAACAGAERVADLFCGVGPFALRLAQSAKTRAVDSHAESVAACDAAMRATPGLRTLGTEVRDLFHDPLVAGELKPFDAVVFDPPRSGAAAQAAELAQSVVPTVVAVSCNPATLARDAATLIAGGYTLESVTPVDQFIHSAHVEAVAVFRR